MEMYAGKVGIPYYAQVEAIQNIPLAEAFGSPARMELIESNEAMVDADAEPLQTAENLPNVHRRDLVGLEEREGGS